MLMGPAGFVAVLAGWITTEVGRQPYTVYGLLRTADSVSPIDAAAVGSSLIAFIVVYFARVRRRHLLHPAPDGPDARTSTSRTCAPGAPIRAAGITPGTGARAGRRPAAGGGG